MKKGMLFSICLTILSLQAMAQTRLQLDPLFMGTSSSLYTSPTSDTFYGKTWSSSWYNFMDAADVNQGGLINFMVFDYNTLFPDSLVLQRYKDSNSTNGYSMAYIHFHHTGQVFDPTSFYYTELLSEYNSYEIDSISLAYRYAHFIPGSVDTLEFQIYYDTAIKVGNLAGTVNLPSTAWVNYDRNSGKGLGSSQEWRILLDADDSSWTDYKVVKLALPNTAYVKAGGLFAITCRFLPGYSYSTGDTIGESWNDSLPAKKLNTFVPLVGYDTAKILEDSYNHGLYFGSRLFKSEPGGPWSDIFIPGNAWEGYNQYAYFGFHVAANVGLSPVEKNSLRIYPNPVNAGENINITLTLSENTNLSVELYDMLGNKVRVPINGHVEAGQHHIHVSTLSFPSGIYVYRIKAGEQTLSGKVGIAN